MMINTITLLLGVTLLYSTPMIFGALGGVLSERSGVINIGIEGMMTFGAFAGAAAGYYSGNPWIGVLCAALAGGVLALLHAVAAITCQADQTISGVAINLLGPALAVFFCRLAFDGSTMSYPVANKLPKIFGSGVEGIWANLNVDIMVVVALLFAVAMCINVYKTRYACVILSGILAGIGGATVTLGIVAQFTQTSIAGQGFIALAAVIFGKWKPMGAYRACLIFGFSQALTVVLGGGAIAVPTEILAMLPYVLTIVILILFVGKSVAPKADGVPYVKGRR